MRYRTHIAGGLALGYLALNKVPLLNIDPSDTKAFLIVTTGVILGSLIPDIDCKNSYISKRARLTSCVARKAFKHRGFTHSIVGALVMPLTLFFILQQTNINSMHIKSFVRSFSVGIISHILLDVITIEGVSLFYPFNKKRFSLFGINVNRGEFGRLKENIFFIILMSIAYFGLFAIL